jgi:peptide/nickel transport system substrate-binding protein
MDRQAIVDAIWRGQARLANTLLPVGHWAAAGDDELAKYPHDVARAQRLLQEAGFPAGKDGVRIRLTMKTSTDETTRLMVAVLQQQLREAGIRLEIRSAEFGTFYSDVTRGAFEPTFNGSAAWAAPNVATAPSMRPRNAVLSRYRDFIEIFLG